jgi:hypothetical protein
MDHTTFVGLDVHKKTTSVRVPNLAAPARCALWVRSRAPRRRCIVSFSA